MRATQLAHLFERRKKSLGRERNLSLRAFSSAQGQDTVHGRHGTLNSLKVHHLWSGCGHGACATRPPRKDRYKKIGREKKKEARTRPHHRRTTRPRPQPSPCSVPWRKDQSSGALDQPGHQRRCLLCSQRKEPSPAERTQREAESKTNRERVRDRCSKKRDCSPHSTKDLLLGVPLRMLSLLRIVSRQYFPDVFNYLHLLDSL